MLNATVLGTRGCSPLSDTSLLKAWNVSEMLVGTDPGYAAQLNRARNLMETEWSQRHAGETIGQQADHVMNNVTITYVDRTPALEHFLAAFEKADFTVRLDHDDTSPDEFRARHDGETFHVAPENGEGWNGQRNDLIAECVMMQAVVSIDEAGQQISHLRDAGLPRILGRGQPQRGRRTVQPVRGLHEQERERGPSLRPAGTVRIRHGGTRRSVFRGRSNGGWGKSGRRFGRNAGPGEKKEEAVESETQGETCSSSEATGKNETDLVDLYEPEEWERTRPVRRVQSRAGGQDHAARGAGHGAVPAGRPHRRTGRTVARPTSRSAAADASSPSCGMNAVEFGRAAW